MFAATDDDDNNDEFLPWAIRNDKSAEQVENDEEIEEN